MLVQNGQTFLFGRVRHQQQRQHAEDIALDIKGIERVDNRIVAAEQEDARIEETIRDGLSRSPFVDSDPIEVDVDRGIAVLNGTADSFSELIVAVARAFRGGARTVRSQLLFVKRSAQDNVMDANP